MNDKDIVELADKAKTVVPKLKEVGRSSEDSSELLEKRDENSSIDWDRYN